MSPSPRAQPLPQPAGPCHPWGPFPSLQRPGWMARCLFPVSVHTTSTPGPSMLTVWQDGSVDNSEVMERRCLPLSRPLLPPSWELEAQRRKTSWAVRVGWGGVSLTSCPFHVAMSPLLVHQALGHCRGWLRVSRGQLGLASWESVPRPGPARPSDRAW